LWIILTKEVLGIIVPSLLTISAIIEVVALALWTGGLAVLTTIVAPAIFQSSPSRESAGRMFGLILSRFHRLGWGCGIALLTAGVLRYAARNEEEVYPAEFTRYLLGLLMLGLSLYGRVVIDRRLEKLRGEMPGGIDHVPPEDPRRIEFRRLHGQSSALIVFTLLVGLAAVVLFGLEAG